VGLWVGVGWPGGGAGPGVAWGWDPGLIPLVRGKHGPAHGWQFDVLSGGAGQECRHFPFLLFAP